MNARNQLLVILTALMMICSSGAMVAGAAPAATVSGQDDVTEDESDVPDENETATDEEPDDVTDDEEEVEEVGPPDETAADDETVDEAQDAYVTFEDQATEGETVVVEEVTMASGGFVTIHDSSLLVGNVFESVIGTSEYLEEGTHENVEVSLDEPHEENETLIAMPHRDTNDNQAYDFVETEGAADIPYLTAEDEPVTDEGVVTIGAPAEEPVEEEPAEEQPEEEPVEEEPVEEQPEEEPVEEEPVEEQPEEEPVEEEPVEEEPVEEEPVEEQPEEDVINVIIEQATVFVFFGEMADDMPAGENETAVDANGIEVGDTDANDTETDETDTATDDMNTEVDESDLEGMDTEINIIIEQVTVVPGNAHHEDVDGMEGVEDGAAEDTVDDTNATDEETETINEGAHQIVIEQATVFVFLEDIPEEPIDEEPIDEEPADEEPVEEEPVEEQPEEAPAEEQPEEAPVEEPVEEEPAEEAPVEEQPEAPVDEAPVEEQPEAPVGEEPVEEEPADSFTVENLEAPETAEIGETITVTATVSNPTDEERTENVQFRLDGNLVDSQELTLAADETTDVEFEVETEGLESGEYIHMILTESAGQVAPLELTEEMDDAANGTEGDSGNETDDEGDVVDETGDDNATAEAAIGVAS